MNFNLKCCEMVVAMVLGAALMAEAQTLPKNQNPTPPRRAGDPIIKSLADKIALHDAKSSQYQRNCLVRGCHDLIFDQTSLNSRIRPPHSLVEIMGIASTQCDFCHVSTEIVNGMKNGRGSAGVIGKNVDPVLRCYPCHSIAGPAKPLYSY